MLVFFQTEYDQIIQMYCQWLDIPMYIMNFMYPVLKLGGKVKGGW